MQLARVTGTVVATVKTPGLTGVKLLLVQPLDRHLEPVGGQVVAADAIHMAGPASSSTSSPPVRRHRRCRTRSCPSTTPSSASWTPSRSCRRPAREREP